MLQLLLLQLAPFVTVTTIGSDVKVRRAEQTDLPLANPYDAPNSYFRRYGDAMGYILVDHFVTLWRGWH
jgi:hypothetical protein